MSMHLVGPYLTTTRYSKKQKKSNSKRKAEADAKHLEWLRKKGVHPDQLEQRLENRQKYARSSIPNYSDGNRNSVPLSNAVGNGFKTGIMQNLHKESKEVQEAILAKAKRIEVAYNKGPAMYITPGTDLTTLGSKSRRG